VIKFEILRALVNSKFDFIETRKKVKDDLTKLLSDDEEYYWKIMSPELIIFDQWFESKVFKQKLGLKIPPYVKPTVSVKELELEVKPKNVYK